MYDDKLSKYFIGYKMDASLYYIGTYPRGGYSAVTLAVFDLWSRFDVDSPQKEGAVIYIGDKPVYYFNEDGDWSEVAQST